MVYERFVRQLDGCQYCSGGLNCTCASHAMWLYRASQGKTIITACAVRQKTGDRVGGTHLGQMEAVTKSMGIASGVVYRPATWQFLIDRIATRRYGAHLNLLYAPIAGTRYDCFFGSFKGNHDVYVSGPGSVAGTWRVGDPGADGRQRGSKTAPRGYQDIPVSLLRRAAGLLDIGGRPLGDGKVYTYITPPDPITVAAPHYGAVTTRPTALWNEDRKAWVYNGTNNIPVGTKLEVRGAKYTKGGISCYPITSGRYSSNYAGYYVPVANVKLGGPV